MKKIRFLVYYQVKAVGGPSYDAGSIHEMAESSCQHFVNRGVAEYCIEEKAIQETKAKPTKKALVEKEVELSTETQAE